MTILLAGAAIALCAFALISGTTQSAARGAPQGGESPGMAETDGVFVSSILECFTLEDGKFPNEVVRLVTSNFGTDRVVVRGSKMTCETANKYPYGTENPAKPTSGQVLQCFNIDNGQDPNRDYFLDTENFGRIKATVRKAVSMCENALKFRPGRQPFGTEADAVLECFDVTHATPTSGVPKTVVTNNWGVDNHEVRRLAMMCEHAQKLRAGSEPFGEAIGVAYACFQFGNRLFDKPATLVTRNFGPDEVRVTAPAILCERAEKSPAGIRIPAGHSLTLHDALFSACNQLAYGYQLGGGPLVEVAAFPGGCFEQGAADVTIGPVAVDTDVRIYLQDLTCGAVYFSDGDHARLTGTPTGWIVDITDAGGFCEAANIPRPPETVGNIHVELIVS